MLARSRAVAAAAAISLLFVAACGADGADDEGTATTTTAEQGGEPTTTEAQGGEDNGIADLEPEEILDEARTALNDAGSVHVKGSISEGSQDITMDMGIGRDGSAGTMTMNDQKIELIVTPETVYMKGDAKFYEQFGGESVAKLLGDKWLSVAADSEQGSEFAGFTDFDEFTESMLDPDTDGMTKGDEGDIDGTPAISLVDDEDKSNQGELWVATEGEPYPLQINLIDDDSQKISFSDHGEEIDVTPPPADDVLDLEELRPSDDEESPGN